MSTTASDSSRGRPGAWRFEVLLREARLRADAAGVSASGVTERLDQARLLAMRSQTPLSWWSGSQVESAWLHLRLAEEQLISATTDPQALTAHALSALAHAEHARLAKEDPRVVGLMKALEGGAPSAPSVLTVLQAAHESSDAQHRGVRAFRNQLRVVTVGLLVLAVLAVAAVALAGLGDGILPAPPELTSAWQVMSAAMALGAVGALFSAMPSLAQAPERAGSPFDPILEQAALKVVIGSWSALVGLVAVGAGVASAQGGPQASSFAGFALMCALFGSTQEALTRFADRRASVVSATRS